MNKTIFTIGHSNRSIKDFLALARAHKLKTVIDIRTIPRSRHNPQFNEKRLAKALKKHHISYRREPLLGGLRHAKKDSLNLGWRNLSFRGYADYMATDGFEAGLKSLIALARKSRTAIMCAEAVPWRCHRSLVADALKKRGFRVLHIISASKTHPHVYTSFLRMGNGKLTYPAD